MACEEIKQQLASLRSEKRQVEAVLDNLQGAGLLAAQENLANLTAQIAAEEKRLNDCEALAAPHTAQPFTGRVKDIFCSEASKEIGKDEPYLLIASVDMLAQVQAGPLPVTKPSVHCFKVGPWDDVKAGTRHLASQLASSNNPAFWDLDSQARIVRSPQDVVFLVGLVEHDGASPDAIRGAVHTALEASVLNNLGRTYATFAATLTSAMQGAIDTFSGAGVGPSHANFDDRVGTVKQLSLTTDDLDSINALGKREKTLSFTRVKSSGKISDAYTTTFSFEA
jgi:hypothetical protein